MKLLRLPPIPIATRLGMLTGVVIFVLCLGWQTSHPPSRGHLITTPAGKQKTVGAIKSPSPSLTASPKLTANPTLTPAKALTRTYANPTADGLITNEYAFFNAGNATALASTDFEMTSGSLFGKDGSYWTGNPDSCTPDAHSSHCTNSNVFRLDTKQRFTGNLAVNLSLMQLTNVVSSSCNQNGTCWYGTHIWLRYQSQFNLYYASVNRADGQMVIKRKVPCGSDNDGTYFVLGNYVPHSFQPNTWNHYRATIQTNADASVTIKLYDTSASTSTPVVVGTDRGGINPNWTPGCTTDGHYSSATYQPITAPGGVGIRGDYANFLFRDLQISAL